MLPRHIITRMLLFIGLSASAPALAETYALLVGINDYTSMGGEAPDDSGRTWRDLQGAVNDASAMASLLQARYGVPAEHIRLLTAEAGGLCGEHGCPTRDAILGAMDEYLLARAKAGNQLLFYYAGHGSQVGNPESREQDEFDESLVPMDALAGAPDIRDKELRQRFNRMLDGGARLVAVVDSCHSGSISRGAPLAISNGRELEPVSQLAAATGDPGPVPARRGAVVISASSPAQLALEKRMPDDTTRGGFSYALIKALMSGPVNEPLERTFQRTEVFMKGLGLLQSPQLATSDARKSQPLFAGGASKGLQSTPSLVVGVISADEQGVLTHGGRDLGLYPGTRLQISKPQGDIQLEISENSGLTRSIARVLPGSDIRPASGDLAVVTAWAGYEPSQLRVWVGQEQAAAISQALQSEPMIRLVDNAGDADYWLNCRDGALETKCAWQLPGEVRAGSAAGLPQSTDWVGLEELPELAHRLAKLKSWVSLASPPALLPFPYHLEIRHAGTDQAADLQQGVFLGERYRIVLTTDAENVARAMIESKPKYVYVGGIDSRGNGYLLYPSDNPEYEHCEQLPCRTASSAEYTRDYLVFSDYLVTSSETDLLYLITSDERIDPNILKFEGVRSGEAAEQIMRSGGASGLEALLARYSSGRSRSGHSTPLNWSIEHYLVPVAGSLPGGAK